MTQRLPVESETLGKREFALERAVPVLVERDRESGRSRPPSIAGLAAEGSVLLVEGPPGIGKTGLLRAAEALAGDRGYRVLSARAGELERDFPYGVTKQLLEATSGGCLRPGDDRCSVERRRSPTQSSGSGRINRFWNATPLLRFSWPVLAHVQPRRG